MGLDQLSQGNYFGVKAFGSNNLEYEVVYNYNGMTGVSDELNLRLCSRENTAALNWVEEGSATLDSELNTLTLGGQTTDEFILGSVGRNTLFIEDLELLNLSVYPNPAKNSINLPKFDTPGDSYQIFDVKGNSINKKIDIRDLQQGMYFLKLENSNLYKFLKN